MPTEIPLSQPDITSAEIEAVNEVMRSGRLSIGPQQEAFERLVAERTGRAHGIAVSSGTAGLHLVLSALGIGPGDEVITTPFSFIASANAVLYVGAKPVFVDIDPRSLNMDPAQIESAITDKTKAILAVEVFGNPTHMDTIASIAQRHEIPLIEDACEALGGTLRDRPVGSFGRAAVFGFYPNKQITTGEGGMVVTDDDRLARAIQSMRNHGRAVTEGSNTGGSQYHHERLGYNYRLSEIAAAIGVVQMQRLDEILTKRQELACLYVDKLMEFPDLILPTVDDQIGQSWFVFVARLSDPYGAKQRDRVMTGMLRHDVGCSNYFPPIHLQPFYKEKFGYREGDFPVTESVAARTIALPFYTQMDSTQVELVGLTLQVMLQREQLLRPQSEDT